MSRVSRRDFLRHSTALALAAAGGPALIARPWPADADEISGDLVACVAGGAWETAFREHMGKPFMQKYPKVKLNLDLSAGTAQLAKLRAARGRPPFDTVQMLDEQMDIAFREGLIESFDATEIPNVKDLYSISMPTKWQKGRQVLRRAPELGPARPHVPHRQGEDTAEGVARLLEAGIP